MSTREADVIVTGTIWRSLGQGWSEPTPYGEDSWVIQGLHRRIIISVDNYSEPGVPWVHASVSYADEWRVPSYSDLKQLHAAVFGNGHAYQCFVPPGEHVNIRGNVLHLWGRPDGQAVLPDFGREGTI